MMRVCRILAVFVSVLYFGNENEVYASPIAEPCGIFMCRHRHMKSATMTAAAPAPAPAPVEPPPKTEEQMREDIVNEKVRQYKMALQELYHIDRPVPVPTPAAAAPALAPAPAFAPTQDQAKSFDMNTFFAAYMEFITKFFNMF